MKRKCWHEYPWKDGDIMESYECWGTTMREASPFHTTLKFLYFTRGRSSSLAWFVTSDGITVPMFLSNLEEIIPSLENGQITATWIVVKKGQNYGVAIEELPKVH